jgi:putative phosphoesterase
VSCVSQPPLLRKTATLPIRDDGSLRLAVVADSHSSPHPAAATLLAARRPDAILHAGDIGDLAVLDALATVAPVLAVRGNIDVRADSLPDVLTLNLVSAAGLLVRILLVHIAVNGPRLRADIVRLAQAEDASLVVCGHSHVPFIGRDRGITVFNPGSVGPRRFRLPILFGTVDLTPTEVRLAHVDCETGNAWSPPSVGRSAIPA